MGFAKWSVCLAALALAACSGLQPAAPEAQMQVFLLAGQSNMAGRGAVEEIDRTPHPRIEMLDESGQWVPATEPLHFDKPGIAGVGPGFSFARELVKRDPDITIGLVPVAVGGSSITTWVPGGYHEQTGSHPWDDAVRRLEIAARAGELKAILWHQGESDSRGERAAAYEPRLHDLIRRFREVAGNPDLRFIVGELGQFKEPTPGRKLVRTAHATVPEKVPGTRFVSSAGLDHKGDGTHFDAASARELGRRYAVAYVELQGRSR